MGQGWKDRYTANGMPRISIRGGEDGAGAYIRIKRKRR